MKKIINAPGDIVPEMIAGLTASYPQYLKQIPETTAVVRNDAAFKQKKKSGLSPVAAQVTNRCTPAMSVKACWMQPLPVRSSPHPPRIRFMPRSRRLTKAKGF